jgi:LacI family transcriptional regulator
MPLNAWTTGSESALRDANVVVGIGQAVVDPLSSPERGEWVVVVVTKASRGNSGRARRSAASDPDTGAVTLQAVADLAGVSLATASRVMNAGSRTVGAQMAERVTKAALDLGYTANLHARAMATGQSTMVGIVVRDIADPYFSTIAAGFIEVAYSRDLLVCLSSTHNELRREPEYVALLRAQRARAVVLVGSRSADYAAESALKREVQAFQRGGGRVVCVGQALLGVDAVVPDNAAGAEALAEALVAAGHRRFVVLAGPADVLTAQHRLGGFVGGLRSHGLDVVTDGVFHGEFTRDGGYDAMGAALALGLHQGAEPLCVFAVTDVMAVGALARLREAGLSVPNDVALAGFDDIITLRDVYPPLTTVRLPLKSMGEMAAGLILTARADEFPRTIPVSCEVMLRLSTSLVSR